LARAGLVKRSRSKMRMADGTARVAHVGSICAGVVVGEF
jgi:hypothetical protein